MPLMLAAIVNLGIVMPLLSYSRENAKLAMNCYAMPTIMLSQVTC